MSSSSPVRSVGRRISVSRVMPRTPGRWHPKVVAALMGTVSLAVYVFMSLQQWGRMQTPSWDLAIFAQAAKQYASFSAPIVDIKGAGFNLLGDHFHPILVLLGPLYAMSPSGLTLMVVQDALLATAVAVFGWFGTRHLGVLRGVCLSLGFALSFGVLEGIRVQFHEVSFAIPLMSLALCYLSTGRLRAAVLWSVPLVFVKEDLGVSTAMIGLLVTARSARGRGLGVRAGRIVNIRTLCTGNARRGMGLMLWGFAWSALAVFVILPWLNPHGQFAYGDKVDIVGAVADPLQSFGLMFYPWVKTQTLMILVVTGAGAFLRSPLVWVGVPTLAWRFLSNNSGYWDPTWHYNLVLMPILFAAVFDAALRTRAVRGGVLRRAVERMATVGPVLSAVVGLVLVPYSPLAATIETAQAPLPENVDAKQRAIRVVPEGTSVASDLSVLTYLVPRHDVRWIGTKGDPAPEFIVLDQASGTWNGPGSKGPTTEAEARYGSEYTIAFDNDGLVVLQRSW